MSKVSRRLTIVVLGPLKDWPEIQKLEEQGHTIFCSPSITEPVPPGHPAAGVLLKRLEEADLIIGPQCWYFDIKHRKYLTQAIKQARLKRYGIPAKKAGKKDVKDNITDGSGDDTSSVAAAKEHSE